MAKPCHCANAVKNLIIDCTLQSWFYTSRKCRSILSKYELLFLTFLREATFLWSMVETLIFLTHRKQDSLNHDKHCKSVLVPINICFIDYKVLQQSEGCHSLVYVSFQFCIQISYLLIPQGSLTHTKT